jgi:hypothetical protein
MADITTALQSRNQKKHLPQRHGDTERTKSKSKPQPRGHRESKRALRSGKEKFDSNGKWPIYHSAAEPQPKETPTTETRRHGENKVKVKTSTQRTQRK